MSTPNPTILFPQPRRVWRLRDWSIRQTANRFVLHPNTISLWLQEMDSGAAGRLLGDVSWNRIDDAVRWVVHELRRLFLAPVVKQREAS